MNLEPHDWNVVVVGFWNRAILTPQGIATKIFDLPRSTPVDVQIAIDGIAPPRVRHEGIIVSVDDKVLTIHPETFTGTYLERAIGVARRAKTILPETPIMAFGANLRYKIIDPSDILLQQMVSSLDGELSDNDFEIKARTLRRQLKFDFGVLNMKLLVRVDNSGYLEFNFHCDTEIDFNNWLNLPIGRFLDTVDTLKSLISAVAGA